MCKFYGDACLPETSFESGFPHLKLRSLEVEEEAEAYLSRRANGRTHAGANDAFSRGARGCGGGVVLGWRLEAAAAVPPPGNLPNAPPARAHFPAKTLPPDRPLARARRRRLERGRLSLPRTNEAAHRKDFHLSLQKSEDGNAL